MPAVQTDYSRTIRKAVHGQVADGFPHGIDTRSNTDSEKIQFGVPVSEGTGDWACKPFVGNGTAADNDYVGVAIKNIVQQAETDEYNQYTNVDVLVFGDVWLKVGAAVAPGDDVTFANGSTPTAAKPNGWGSRAVETAAATKNTQVPNARWMTTAAADGLAIARFGYADSIK